MCEDCMTGNFIAYLEHRRAIYVNSLVKVHYNVENLKPINILKYTFCKNSIQNFREYINNIKTSTIGLCCLYLFNFVYKWRIIIL